MVMRGRMFDSAGNSGRDVGRNSKVTVAITSYLPTKILVLYLSSWKSIQDLSICYFPGKSGGILYK